MTLTYTDKEDKIKKRTKYVNEKVSARVTHYTRESSASIIGAYHIIDVQTGVVKDFGSFDEKSEFKTEWGEFAGNKAALSISDKKLCNVEETFAPIEDEMISDVANRLSNQLAEKFKAYAR